MLYLVARLAVFLMMESDTRVMGRFVDDVWNDLNGIGDRVGGIPSVNRC